MTRVVPILTALWILAAPLAAETQPARTVKIGWLANARVPSDFDPFRQAMNGLGYLEGRNLVMEQRYAAGADRSVSMSSPPN